MCLCVVVLLSSLSLCGSGTSPKCVCVCISILVSLCASQGVGSAAWFLAGGSQLLAAQMKQWVLIRERKWQNDINKQRRGKTSKVGGEERVTTPLSEEKKNEKENKTGERGDEEADISHILCRLRAALQVAAAVAVAAVFFDILLLFVQFSNRQIHTSLVLLVFHSQKVNLRVGSWKSIRQRVSPCNRTTLTVTRSHEISLALLRGKNYMCAVACVAAGLVCASPSELGLRGNDC